jgi:NAD(P)-dependent dehydrogenase (short-subunit alcohol dehydrogenase family)
MSKSVILVTGASSGFGLMTVQSLAQAGHTVYASMRETAGPERKSSGQICCDAQHSLTPP